MISSPPTVRFVTGVLVAGALLAPDASAASKRATVIVSDLHLSEAERSDEAFAFFLRQQDGDTDLVLAGDVFELGWEEDQSLAKLERLFEIHAMLLDELATFARSRAVTFVPGDHDWTLSVPRVAARLRERLGRVGIADNGIWVSGDGHLLVEHGHLLPGTADGVEAERQFERLEAKYSIIDEFAERLMGLKYGLSLEREKPVPNDLLKLLFLNVSWQQFRRDLELEVEAPEWNLSAIRAMGDAFLLQSVPEDDPLYGAWTTGASELSDDEVRLLCDYRAAVRRARRRMEQGLTQLARVGPAVAECPRLESSSGPSYSYYWSTRDERYRMRLASFEEMPDVYVHGHTHLPDRGFVPGPNAEGPSIVNAGGFKRTITPAEFEQMRNGGNAADLLARLRTEDLPACYSYVVVEPYEAKAAAQLEYWHRLPDGVWTSGRSCEGS